MTNINQFFEFEADFVDSLRCIPMIVRMKLDTCGIKLKLHQWNKFDQQQRQKLVNLSCLNNQEIKIYRKFLQNLITETTGEIAKDLKIDPSPPWLNNHQIPIEIIKQTQDFNIEITLEKWQKLNPLQRFALLKLSNSKHENSNFLPALQEFNLV